MQKSITFKNANISFSDVGKGTAVVLIHGFLENSTMWKNIIPRLSKRNRIITVDLLGHGKSDCLGYVHSMELFAESIEAVLKHLKIRKYFLVGHSLGGYVALAFAEKNPKKVKGFCLMNSTSNADDKGLKLRRETANKMVQNKFTELVHISFNYLFTKDSQITFSSEIKEALQIALNTSVQCYIAAQEGMRIRSNRNNILAENDFKKLIIVGKKDPVLDYKISLEEAKRTNSEIVVLPNGHMSHIENKEELIEILVSFVKKSSKK
jgi:pimeloyl-ACP methyl ester carboxylesterase